jgi:hypothetical protein
MLSAVAPPLNPEARTREPGILRQMEYQVAAGYLGLNSRFYASAFTCFNPRAKKLAKFTETAWPMQSSKIRIEKI